MSQVAKQLRQAREASGMTVSQVAESTKIRSDHIEALEAGNFNAFSAPIYIRGFVRTYARLMKLDDKKMLAELDAELSGDKKFREPPPFTDRKHTLVDTLTLLLAKINWKVSILVGGVVVALAIIVSVYSAVRHNQTTDPLAGLTAGIYQPQPSQPSQAGETIPLPAPKK